MTASNVVGEVKSRSGWAIFMGVLTAALGAVLILYPLFAAAVTTVVLGWVLILAGIAQFVFALYAMQAGQFFWKLLSSLLYTACGIFIVASPATSLVALTRPVDGWGWLLFDAAWALLVGVLILAQWPSSSAWAIGTLVGASILMNGISRIAIASKIRSGATRVQQFAHGRA